MSPRVVFDCNIYLQALARKDGPAARCVELAIAASFDLVVTDETIAEFHRVTSRPKVRKKFLLATDEDIRKFADRVFSVATRIESVPEVFNLKRDPEDSKYINLAVAAHAKFIVSRDNDLLDLMTGTDEDAETFRKTCPDLAILDPVAFLNTIQPEAS